MESPQELPNYTGPLMSHHNYYGYQDPTALPTIADNSDSFENSENTTTFTLEPVAQNSYFAPYSQPFLSTPAEDVPNGHYHNHGSYFDFLPPQPLAHGSPFEEYQYRSERKPTFGSLRGESPLMATPSSAASSNSSFSGGYPRAHSHSFISRTSSVSSLASSKVKVKPLVPQVPQIMKEDFKIVRGVSGGGAVTRPPTTSDDSPVKYVPIKLRLHEASEVDLNRVPWDRSEIEDGRRIIRIERCQSVNVLDAYFSVLGSASHNPDTDPGPPGVDVIEVSCLKYNSADDEDDEDGEFYITSVEVVNLIETLIGIKHMDPALRRREKGRIRSNLMPFWSKKPVPSKRTAKNHDLSKSRSEFARRIMNYKIRKPRGFDKDVRILSWQKLIPALHRALSCYYAEVPTLVPVDGKTTD